LKCICHPQDCSKHISWSVISLNVWYFGLFSCPSIF
jgi:hypothetical protein